MAKDKFLQGMAAARKENKQPNYHHKADDDRISNLERRLASLEETNHQILLYLKGMKESKEFDENKQPISETEKLFESQVKSQERLLSFISKMEDIKDGRRVRDKMFEIGEKNFQALASFIRSD